MKNLLLNPQLIKLALRVLVRGFILIVVIATVALVVIRYDLLAKFRDTSSGLHYNKTYAEIAQTGVDIMIADTDATRTKGLGGFSSLRDNQGMFFVFEETAHHGFWMKDMKISIDIIWFNEYYEVIHIEENVRPETYPRIYGDGIDSRYVLEMRAGFVAEHEIRVGDVIQVL